MILVLKKKGRYLSCSEAIIRAEAADNETRVHSSSEVKAHLRKHPGQEFLVYPSSQAQADLGQKEKNAPGRGDEVCGVKHYDAKSKRFFTEELTLRRLQEILNEDDE